MQLRRFDASRRERADEALGHADDRGGVPIHAQSRAVRADAAPTIGASRRPRVSTRATGRAARTPRARAAVACTPRPPRRRRTAATCRSPRRTGPAATPRSAAVGHERQVVQRAARAPRGSAPGRSTRGARGCRRSGRADTSGGGTPERASERVAGNAGDDVHLVAGRHPLAAVLVRPVGRRVHFRREVVREEQDAHDRSVRL